MKTRLLQAVRHLYGSMGNPEPSCRPKNPGGGSGPSSTGLYILVACAAALAFPAVASAQTPWSTKLTVHSLDTTDRFVNPPVSYTTTGCWGPSGTGPACGNKLDGKPSFPNVGQTYTVKELLHTTRTNALSFLLDKPPPSEDFNDLTLYVGSQSFPIAEDKKSGNGWKWTGINSSPFSGARVTVKLTVPAPPDQQSEEPVDRRPLRLALWTDRPAYRAGETLRLFRTTAPRGDRGGYELLYYLERAGGGQRRYLSPTSGSMDLREEPVDHRGYAEGAYRVGRLPEAERALAWEGEAPDPGLWQFVAELRRPGADKPAQRAWAKFVVAQRSQLLIRRGFDRELTSDLTLRADTVYHMSSRVFVRDGATLRIEAGALVKAWGPGTAIIVEPGGRIEAEGTREKPVVLTCSMPTGLRQPGCWGGLRLLGQAPLTRGRGEAAGVPASRAGYGGSDPQDSSGTLRHVRVEFAGAGQEAGTAAPALGLYGVGSGTVLDHVQAHASRADGILFSGGTADCSHCVADGSGTAGLAWQRGWQGTASHLYVQHGPEGGDGLSGSNDARGHDLEPRSRPLLSNVTLVHSRPHGRLARRKAGLQLSTGTALVASDLLVTGFGGGAIDAAGRAALLFSEGESSVARALLHRNGYRSGAGQLRGGIVSGVQFEDQDPKLRNILWEANPDPRPKPGSPALPKAKSADRTSAGESASDAEYIGAFNADANWLEEWTFFGPESDYDTRAVDEGDN